MSQALAGDHASVDVVHAGQHAATPAAAAAPAAAAGPHEHDVLDKRSSENQTLADADADEDEIGFYDHYRFDDDNPPAGAPSPCPQTHDTLGASPLGPTPPSASAAAAVNAREIQEPPASTAQSAQAYHALALSHDRPSESQSQSQSQDSPSTQPSQSSSRPESVPVHAAAMPPRSTPIHSPRSTRSQSLAASLGSQSPIRRKPLSPTASPLAVRFSAKGFHMPSPYDDLHQPDSGYFSLDSPDLYALPPSAPQPGFAGVPAPVAEPALASVAPLTTHHEADIEEQSIREDWSPSSNGPPRAAVPDTRNSIADSNPAVRHSQTANSRQSELLTGSEVTSPVSHESGQTNEGPSEPTAPGNDNTSSIMPMLGRASIPQKLDLDHPNSDIPNSPPNHVRRPATSSSVASSLNKPLPKSPPLSPSTKSPVGSSKLINFFGWGAPTPTVSDDASNRKDYSPIPSPVSHDRDSSYSDESPVEIRNAIPVQAHAPEGGALNYIEAYFPTPPNSYTQVAHIAEIEEMEDELKAISAELAQSIRREMDLEDLVERLQTENGNPQGPGKRTSDYFSDSGYSTAKFSDYDSSKDEIVQIQRKAEQEKAQLRLELTGKLQEERGRRSLLDQQIKELADKASQADAAKMISKDADARVKDLENTCEDLRRRLSEEREVKDNFQDLLSALKSELENTSLERDNLRDEVVPQLRARVEGLEAQQAENEKLAYETTKMQQELQALRDSKTKHDSLARLRSSSITGQSFKLGRPPSGIHAAGLSRSTSVKGGHVESRETLSERLKDVEAQRDALHNALKNLLDRQDFQNRENEKKIRQLETERDRLLSASPRKVGFEREVLTLREEVSVLRRRAEEAIEQKWQVEKGLIGLKSDLDRAEEEITSLKALLKEKDILVPDAFSRYSNTPGSGMPAVSATSSSLEKAYKDLQASYREALGRIKNMDIGETSASQDEKTRLAMERLEETLSAALHDRDDARLEAAALQDQVDSLQETEKSHLASEGDLADQLRDSANRIEELTQQVRAQLAVNANLRTRLSETIARGEATQKANKDRLANMQDRMRVLEEQVVAAQTAAEERVNSHEEELGRLREANNGNLQRLRESGGGLKSPRLFPPKSPVTPLLSPNSTKTPRMRSSHSRKSSSRPSTAGQDEEDTKQVELLKARVAELEKALVTADFEMQEVVGRMSAAQIEVLTLQEEREAAARETRRIQKLLDEERLKAFEERFNTISG